MQTARRVLLSAILAWCAASACAATSPVLDERMQLFKSGNLRGFALAELPDDGREIYAEQDFKDLAATGANVVRVAIQLRKCRGCDHYDMPEAHPAPRRKPRLSRDAGAVGHTVGQPV
jgi:hypothetical protein